MRINKGLFPLKSQPPFIQMLVSLIIMTGIAIPGLILVVLSLKFFFHAEPGSIEPLAESLSRSDLSIIKFSQPLQHIFIFLLPALFISWFMSGHPLNWLGFDRMPDLLVVLVLVVISVLLIPVTGEAGIINSKLTLPPFLDWLEEWILKKEEETRFLTKWLISASTPGGLLLNLFTLAVLPALGEEMLFRGVFQRIIGEWTGSGAMAVWIVAIIFSAFHLQFLGFLPRLILGVVYGYLFLWSGSIWLPVIAHFANNAIPVISTYVVGSEIVEGLPKESLSLHGWVILFPLLLVILLMYFVRENSRSEIKGRVL